MEESVLESLPQEILVICGVNHDDLKQLFHVSKSLHEAAVIAKESRFAYTTPSKIPAFRMAISSKVSGAGEDEKAPNAMRKAGRRHFTQDKKEELMDVTVALFNSDSEDSEEESWPRRKLFKGVMYN